MRGLCRFCDQSKDLIKAHVIPEGFFSKLRRGGDCRLLSNTDFPKRSPIGVYDENILCAKCDNAFGRFDDYAQQLLRTKPEYVQFPSRIGMRAEGCYTFTTVDYRALKLFFISLAWRASISVHSFYQSIKLNPFEAKAQAMLLNGDPGDCQSFGILLAQYLEEEIGQVILEPAMVKMEGLKYCKFYLGGYVAYIKVESRASRPPFAPFYLAPNEPLYIVSLPFRGTVEARLTSKLIEAQPKLLAKLRNQDRS